MKCFLAADRYDPEPRQQDSFDEFNSKTTRKSKYREWKERAGSFGKEFKDRLVTVVFVLIITIH